MLRLRESRRDSDLAGLKLTNHFLAHWLIFSRSEFSSWAASAGLLCSLEMRKSQPGGPMFQWERGIIPKLLFATHHLDMINSPVKFHEYIPYGLGIMP